MKAVQEIVADLRKADMFGTGLDAGHGRSHVRGARVGAWIHYGLCGDCGARGPTTNPDGFFYLTPEDAAEAWNLRGLCDE